MPSLHRVLVSLSFVLTAALAFSQTPLTSLRGNVTDSSGAMLPGAQVVVEQQQTGLRRAQTTDDKGEYQFQQLPPGTYDVIVTATSFASQSTKAELLVNQPAS